jgi:hypothetical protein
MDLDKVIRKLYTEREKLDAIIASLEQLRDSAARAEKTDKKATRKKHPGTKGKKR